MDEKVAAILQNLLELAVESADMHAGKLSEADYRAHCDAVREQMKEAA